MLDLLGVNKNYVIVLIYKLEKLQSMSHLRDYKNHNLKILAVN